MAAVSDIEWTDATWTPIRARADNVGWHCEHMSDGCRNCYAEAINRRLGTGLSFKPGLLGPGGATVFLDEKMLLAPLKWKKPRRIFVCSMTDLFADFVNDEWIDRMFAVMALCPQHRFQVLTKRAERMREYFAGIPEMAEPAARDALIEGSAQSIYSKLHPDEGDCSLWLAVHMPLPNVWLGISAEDQANADERIPLLLETPAAVRFVSLEPLLGPIKLWDDYEGVLRGCGVVKSGGMTVGTADFPPEGYDDSYPGLDWVIVGGESGPHARPMHPDWARSIRDQCAAADVPFFYKQTGEWAPGETMPIACDARDCPAGTLEDNRDGKLFYAGHGRSTTLLRRVGKRAAGRLLDGVEHNAMPGAQ